MTDSVSAPAEDENKLIAERQSEACQASRVGERIPQRLSSYGVSG